MLLGAGILALVITGSACQLQVGGGTAAHSSPSPSPSTTGSARPSPTPSASASPGQPASVWVLPPVGLNIRATPDTSGQAVTVARQGTELTVTGSQAVGDRIWLKIKAKDANGTEGWVLDRPDLVTRTPVQLQVDAVLGYRLLVPAGWTPKLDQSGAVFTSPPIQGETLTVRTADSPDKLPTTPTQSGQKLRNEDVEISGKTTFLTVYRLDRGGFETTAAVRLTPKQSYLFIYDQYGSSLTDANTAAFKQILNSVFLTDLNPPSPSPAASPTPT